MTDSLEPGTDVEVRTTFDRRWARGFVIEGASEQGYRVRRRSDGCVLPAAFPAEALRPVDDRTPRMPSPR